MRSQSVLLGMFLIMCSTFVNAEVSEHKTLVYIDPMFYENSERLLHPYYNYWFTQGPIVEPIAIQSLQANHPELSLCQVGQKAHTVVNLLPSMFYNPQMRIYYSEIKATVYSGGGTLLGTYSGVGEQEGFMSVDVGINQDMEKAYAIAMQDLMGKIQIDNLADRSSEVQLPCNIVAQQAERRIRIN